jgi:hypothetical protein
MAPMLVAYAFGSSKYLVPLGQGGFFYSALFLPALLRGRLLMGSILVALGLGFYLMGGNVVPTAWVAVVFTFLVAVNLSFLSGWKVADWTMGGTLALTFIVIYTAGLNSGSPEATSKNFIAFTGVLAWSVAISLLPVWRPVPPPPGETLGLGETVEQGVRMGIGTSVALFISYLFGFYKFGWAPSAVGHIVRYDEKTTHLRAWGRFLGTVAGAALAVLALAVARNLTILHLRLGAVRRAERPVQGPQDRPDPFLHRHHHPALLLVRHQQRTAHRHPARALQRDRHRDRIAGRALPVPGADAPPAVRCWRSHVIFEQQLGAGLGRSPCYGDLG